MRDEFIKSCLVFFHVELDWPANHKKRSSSWGSVTLHDHTNLAFVGILTQDVDDVSTIRTELGILIGHQELQSIRLCVAGEINFILIESHIGCESGFLFYCFEWVCHHMSDAKFFFQLDVKALFRVMLVRESWWIHIISIMIIIGSNSFVKDDYWNFWVSDSDCVVDFF